MAELSKGYTPEETLMLLFHIDDYVEYNSDCDSSLVNEEYHHDRESNLFLLQKCGLEGIDLFSIKTDSF